MGDYAETFGEHVRLVKEQYVEMRDLPEGYPERAWNSAVMAYAVMAAELGMSEVVYSRVIQTAFTELNLVIADPQLPQGDV